MMYFTGLTELLSDLLLLLFSTELLPELFSVTTPSSLN